MTTPDATSDIQRLQSQLAYQRRLLTLQQELSLLLNQAARPDEALRQVLTSVAQFMEWPLAHVFVPRQRGGEEVLVSGDVWYTAQADMYAPFQEAMAVTVLHRGEGAPGQALARGQVVTLLNIRESPDWVRPLPSAAVGLQAVYAFPVTVEEDVVAVLEFFCSQAQPLDEETAVAIQHITKQLGATLHRLQTTCQLQERESRIRAIFNHTFQFIGLMRPDGTLIEANETALAFGGLTREDVLGKPFWEASWWQLSSEIQEALRHAIERAAQGEFVRYEVDVMGREEQIVTIDFSITPVLDESGQVQFLIPEGRDITESNQMIMQLQEREAQLDEAQKTAHIGHWEWDIEKDQVSWSQEIYRIFGLPVNKADMDDSLEAILERVHPDDLPHLRVKLKEAYEQAQAYEVFHRIIRPDGSERVLHARGRPVVDNMGHTRKLIGTVQDMTEQKEAELKLAQTVRRLSALMEIGQAIAASLKPDVIYERVLTLIRPLLGAEAILLFLNADTELELVAVNQGDSERPLRPGLRVSPDAGIVGQVWQTGRSIFLSGTACRQHLSPELVRMTQYEPNAMLAVPVSWQEQAVGIIEATHSKADAFIDEDLRLLEAVATWTAIAIVNARQYAQLQRRIQESDALKQVSDALAETLELKKLLDLIVENVQQTVPHVDWTTIHLLNKEENRLELAASAGVDISPDSYILYQGEGIAWRVINTGAVMNVPDVQVDERPSRFVHQLNARALLVAPIESRQRRIGTISVQSAIPNTFTHEDERLLSILGVQAGMAIENAQLFAAQQEARQRAERQRERMRYMARRVVSAQEEERARIARELHDEAGQSLTSLKISLDMIRATLPEELTMAREGLAEVLELSDQMMSNLRLLSHNLRPPGLDVYGLDVALSGLAQDFARHTNLKIEYQGGEVPDLPDVAALSLYRFVQEAITNVMKHAEATLVTISLTADEERVRLTVTDNGRGFSVPNFEESTPSGGAGLMGMVERLEVVNGRLEIISKPGQGSKLTAIVPLPESG